MAYGGDEVTSNVEAAILADSDSARDRSPPKKATKRDLIRNSQHPLNQILKKKKSRQYKISDQLIKEAETNEDSS